MNVKEIVTAYLKRHKCDGLVCVENGCSCNIKAITTYCFHCSSVKESLPAVKRRRMVNGRRRTVLVPVEEIK